MTPGRLLRRSLRYHFGIHIAVALGVAVGTAVLAGALLVGDSVKGSLRGLALDRLGDIDHALVADRYFRAALADDLMRVDGPYKSIDTAVPAIFIRGSTQNPDSGARASRVNIHGVDERFLGLFGSPVSPPGNRQVLLNESLAREIGVTPGDALLLRFQSDTLVPSESVMGRKEDNVRTLRLEVAAVVPDRGLGRFGLSPSQQLPSNVFLPLKTLQRALEQEGRANAILTAGGMLSDVDPDADTRPPEMIAVPPQDLNQLLYVALKLDDLGLAVAAGDDGVISLTTDRIVLETATAEAAEAAARAAGLPFVPVLTYMANRTALGERSFPYSTVTALGGETDSVLGGLRLVNGKVAPRLGPGEILLNDWAAKDLRAAVGDRLSLDYYVVGPRGTLDTESREFTLKGIVRLDGLAVDGSLAPRYKGMSEAESMGDWDPPFPVDLSLIRDIDEDYWDHYRSAPKAFVSLDEAKQLWTSRFGQLTSLRVAAGEGRTPAEAAAKFEAELKRHLGPAAHGLGFRPVKQEALVASSGATDFSVLFIAFSMFLIASAAMLVTLLFRLGVERRSREIGLLLSTGQTVATVRRLLLKEAALLTAAGCLIGIPGAVGYGALMVYGLSTWWSDAVGGSFLELHVTAASLVGGVVGAFLLMLVSVWLSVRSLVGGSFLKLHVTASNPVGGTVRVFLLKLVSIRLSVRKLERLSPRSMLAGTPADESALPGKTNRRARTTAWVSAAAAFALLGVGATQGGAAAAGAFFGVGGLLLVSALAWFRHYLLQPASAAITGEGGAAITRLGARNGARYPTRSVLSAALVASATFVIVAVAMNRHDVSSQEPSFSSGDGGFRWIAESDLPLYQDQLTAAEGLPAMDVFSLRVKPGEDASCLNLYRPSKPTLLGAPPGMIARGGFAFQGTLAETSEEAENPWLVLDRKLDDGAIPVFGDMNSVMWILHLGLGDTLEIEDGQGRPRRLVIAGLLSRSVFQSQLILSEKHFLEMFPGHSGYNQFLIETDSREAGALLEVQFADQGFDAATTADRLAGYLIVENTYLSTFQTLGGLGLLLGTLGLAVVMVRNVIERRQELALLQAVGFPRRSISWLVLAENSFLLVFGVLIGAVTALLAVAPHLLGGSAEPPWFSLSLTLAAIVAVGLTAGAAAVAAGLKTPLLASLRRE